jgi:hypothetical protein
VELEAAQAEARESLAALERARREAAAQVPEQVQPDQEAVALREKIESQNATMLALMEENKELKQQQESLEQKQIATEEAIMEAGGMVDLPYPEIRSPNVRRKLAIYMRERVLGESN